MMPSQGIFCDTLVFLFDQLQMAINAIWSLPIFQLPPPQLTDYVASIFGCNL